MCPTFDAWSIFKWSAAGLNCFLSPRMVSLTSLKNLLDPYTCFAERDRVVAKNMMNWINLILFKQMKSCLSKTLSTKYSFRNLLLNYIYILNLAFNKPWILICHKTQTTNQLFALLEKRYIDAFAKGEVNDKQIVSTISKWNWHWITYRGWYAIKPNQSTNQPIASNR